MQKIIIGLAGEIAAGKDTVWQYLVDHYRAVHFEFSDVLKDTLIRLHLPIVRENLANLGEGFRSTFGQDILARTLVRDVAQCDAQLIVVSGIRKMGELEQLKTLTGFHLLFIDVSLETRYERIVRRGQKSDDLMKTFEQFVQDNKHAADSDVAQLKALADFVVVNEGSVDELHQHLDEVIQKLS
jgi:dephospho-CoA kinase